MAVGYCHGRFHVANADSAPVASVTVILNWFEELKRLAKRHAAE